MTWFSEVSQRGGLRSIPGIGGAYNGASGGVLQMAGVLTPGRYIELAHTSCGVPGE
jgi:hypothetical protein